jgi:hypothetical protein
MMAVLDPELTRQMATAKDSVVEAVVHLRPAPGAVATPPTETIRLARELITRAQVASGEQEDAFNVFKYLGSFAVSAKPSFLKALVTQPEVASVIANRQTGPGMIPPVDKRPASVEDVDRKPVKRPKAPSKPTGRSSRARSRTPRTRR